MNSTGNAQHTSPINLIPRIELEVKNLQNKKISKHEYDSHPVLAEETVARNNVMPTITKLNLKRQLLPRSTSRPRLPRRNTESNECGLSDCDYSDAENDEAERSRVAEQFVAELARKKAEQKEAKQWAQRVVGTKSKSKPTTRPKLVEFRAEVESPQFSDDTDETNIDKPRSKSKRLLPVDSSIDIASILNEFQATCWQDVWDARVRSAITVHEDIQALMAKMMSSEHQHYWEISNGTVVRGYTAERVTKWWKELQLISNKSARTYDEAVAQSLRLSKYQLQLVHKQNRHGKQCRR
jgi:hypothetical protein